MSASCTARYAAVCALWLVASLGVSYAFAVTYGGHGSIAIVVFALPVAICGAFASCVSLASTRLRSLSPWSRIALVAAVAVAPIALLSFAYVVALPEYKLLEALEFTAPFAVGALSLAALCEWLVLHPAIARSPSAT